MASYNTDPRYAAFKYGWTAYDCSVAYPYICQFSPEAFPCMPPPNPPSPPPLPPSPPSPPAAPSCESSAGSELLKAAAAAAAPGGRAVQWLRC
jgi:hypothetical protein